MPVTPSYPGVYIEEIPSGVRTITGVATSITAFIGRALRGPTDRAVTINNFGDFECIFGGLWLDSTLGYAVRDFYLNGGGQAIIVRLFHADAKAAKATFTVGGLKLEAASEGAWGANLRVKVDQDNLLDATATALGLAGKADLFNLTVSDASPGGVTEKYLNLSVKESVRRVDRILAAESKLVRWSSIKADAPEPPAVPPTIKVETDKVSDAEKTLSVAKQALTTKQNEHPADDPKAEIAAMDAAKTKLTDAKTEMGNAVSDGEALKVTDFLKSRAEKKGIYALEQADLFNLLCLPPYKIDGNIDANLIDAAISYCEERRAMLLVDSPAGWNDKDKARDGIETEVGSTSKNAAIFFPRLRQPNPLRDNQVEDFAPCGAVAGLFARTDTQRGVWKAPAGLDATLVGVPELSVPLTDAENGELNPKGINCLRAMPAAGRIAWGSRTRVGDDRLASEWKYIPVRRTALFIEESLYRGTQWVVFEPNDEPLWAQIRLNLGAFMQNLFRQGAFQGRTPREAYFVKCDKETTTQTDINLGIVNIVVGFAPLKPAEFVIVKLQQIAGQIAA